MYLSQVPLVLVMCFGLTEMYKYRAVPESEDIFEDCVDEPDDVYGINALFNMSDVTVEMVGETAIMSGNFVVIWDIQPTDRIQFEFRLLQYVYGAWQPTVYSIKILNFCAVMYNKDQYWYKFWISYLKNFNEVKDKCLTPGIILENGNCNITANFETVARLNGRFKEEMRFTAFDKLNNPRPQKICFTANLEFQRLS